MNDDKYTVKSGLLSVGDGHKIYYQQWGNTKSKPIFVLHGGPGSQSKDKHKLVFDPLKHHVIFHDQRGCGKSTYTSLLNANTTQDLSDDVNRLREFFGFKTIQIFGYSWGSTLALYFTINNPKVVEKLILGGIFTGTDEELKHLYNGGISKFAPEAWQRFIEVVPNNDYKEAINHYYEKLNKGTEREKLDHLQRWAQLEPSLMSIDTDYSEVRLVADNLPAEYINPSLIAVHYFKNSCFMKENYIFKSLDKINKIPTVIVQGRFDIICPPETAYLLAQKLGSNCHLHIVPGSHAREGAMRETIKAYVWSTLG